MTSSLPFSRRHIGPSPNEQKHILKTLGYTTLNELIDATIPTPIRSNTFGNLPRAHTEQESLQRLQHLADQNTTPLNAIGMGYYGCLTPAVILRNILENPQWYTPYTPYQAEIAQGRLELLLNFQTMVTELTGLPIANASLLDEATAAAEAMTLCARLVKRSEDRPNFLIDDACHPTTIAILQTRATPLKIELKIQPTQTMHIDHSTCGVLLQYPNTQGAILDHSTLAKQCADLGARLIVAADLLALTLLKAPGHWGADIVIGNTQRLGMPLGFGGPHAAFIATTEACQRQVPGRIVGISKDIQGNPALRLSLQTREQHIRRDKATSNICTAQALPAMVAACYAMYHGPDGLKSIAQTISKKTNNLAQALTNAGYTLNTAPTFDTLHITNPPNGIPALRKKATQANINLRYFKENAIGISIDETTTQNQLAQIAQLFNATLQDTPTSYQTRQDPFMQQNVFNHYHSETNMMRHLDRLQQKDLALTDSMIPLGSCTMKLNAAAEMIPITWPGFANIHPYAPHEQTQGYQKLTSDLQQWLADITGFHAVSLQPNAGSQGEYAGLLAIRAYHQSNGDTQRNICLIPLSAHGTNPASASMAGMKILGVQCDDQGNIDLNHLKTLAENNAQNLAALMITYPSTHGVFEDTIIDICATIHQHGGQVYMDGANMNAMVGLCRPGDIGADVCHLNLHKTFCIPHGGGGPGMGPIGVAKHLTPYLPGDPAQPQKNKRPVSQAPHGSGCILPISYAYIYMMGEENLRHATQIAILNANYIAHKLQSDYNILYKGNNNRVAHECIIDCRPFKAQANIEVEDIAKRLMDYGFHAPTMSWPVPGTLMIEPTESEDLAELDRFCQALLTIRQEIRDIEQGNADKTDNPLKNAPHTAASIATANWTHPYSREKAVYPYPWSHTQKFWPPVARVDNVYGDRNLICTCEPIATYT